MKKKKLILGGFFVATMLIMSFTTVAKSVDDSNTVEEGSFAIMPNVDIRHMLVNSDSAELPEWSIGNFWEYNMTIRFTLPGCVLFCIDVNRMDAVLVDDDYEGGYLLELSGYLNKFVYSNLDYSPSASYISGNAHVDKSTLSMKEFELSLSGNTPNINFDVVMSMKFNPELDFLEFPIALSEKWDISTGIDIAINGNIQFFGNNVPVEKELQDLSLEDTLSVTDIEEINVEAGEFECFKISGELGDSSSLWYSSEIGYLAKVNITKQLLGAGLECNLGLLSTNFNHPKNNFAPNIPTINGTTNGKQGEEYEYLVSTTDPDGEDVYYKIDWGDGTCSDWIGPKASGEEVKVKNTWEIEAAFDIRVKAKDVNCYETHWSEPLAVTMPVTQSEITQIMSNGYQPSSSPLFFQILKLIQNIR